MQPLIRALALSWGRAGAYPAMKKREKLLNKIKHLWRKAGLPSYLHKFGPKKYKSYFLAFCLFVVEKYTHSLRRAQQLLFELNLPVPHWTTIQKFAKRMSQKLWNLLHSLTIKQVYPAVGAIDSTSFSRTNASLHYLRRIDSLKKVKVPVKLSILIDTRRKKILSAKVRSKHSHDVNDVPFLLKSTIFLPRKIVADKAYDSEKVHELCYDKGILSIIPTRKNARRGFFRNKMKKKFNLRIYHRREMVENVFSRLKQNFGNYIRCRTARLQRAEVFARIILYNMSCCVNRLFLQIMLSLYAVITGIAGIQ